MTARGITSVPQTFKLEVAFARTEHSKCRVPGTAFCNRSLGDAPLTCARQPLG
jgi:hypothetical protein